MTVKELKQQLETCDDNANVILAFTERDAKYLLGPYGRQRNMTLVKVNKEYKFIKDPDIPINDHIELFGKVLCNTNTFW